MEGTWSSGMILASGARGREFDSPSAPFPFDSFSLPLPKLESLEFVLLFVAECHWERRLGIGILWGGWGKLLGNANSI